MKAQMSNAWSVRQAGGIPGDLSASEQEILNKIDSGTQNALKQLNEGEQALSNEAVNYVNEHPEIIKGSPGERHADLGEGHMIEEVSGGCELHSPGGIKVPCPKGMGTGAGVTQWGWRGS